MWVLKLARIRKPLENWRLLWRLTGSGTIYAYLFVNMQLVFLSWIFHLRIDVSLRDLFC